MHPVPAHINYLIGGLIFSGILIAFTALVCGLDPDHRLFPRTRLGWLPCLIALPARYRARLIRRTRRIRLFWLVLMVAHSPLVPAGWLLYHYSYRA